MRYSHVLQFLAGLTLASMSTGCGDAGVAREGGAGVSTMVDTAGDVLHIRNEGAAPALTPEPVLALGSMGGLDETAPDEFGRVRGVVADGEGRLYIGDGHAREIRVFSPDGEFLHALGRPGGGPGEIGGLHGLAWAAPETLAVLDYENARVTLLDTRGDQVGQWPWAPITGSQRFLFSAGAGEFYTFFFRGRGAGSRVWVRYVQGEPADTLDIPATEVGDGGTETCFGDGIGFFHNPFGDRVLSVPAPGGETVTARSSEYRLAFSSPGGDTLRTVSRQAERVPVTDADWAPTDSAYAEFREAWAGARCEGAINRPEHRPVLRGIFFDHDGRLMVEWQSTDGPALDLYDHDYRWVATVPLPERDDSESIRLRDGRLYLVAKDSLDVQQVRVFELGTDAPSESPGNAG